MNEQIKIVVVDDRQEERDALVGVLTSLGYPASGTGSGDEAEADLRREAFDLALVNIIISGRSGIKILKRLKKIDPDLEVILAATAASHGKAVLGLKEGACDLLITPCSRQELVAAVERVREKKGLRQSIKNYEGFLYSVLEGLGDAVMVIDRDMRIISANPSFCRQMKLEEHEIVGRYCYEISHGFSRPCYLEDKGCDCAVIQTFNDGKSHKSVHIHKNRNGDPLYVEIFAYPLKGGDKEIYAVVETMRDITRLKEMEKEKRRMEAQLQQTYKMEVVGRLAGGIAHHFNNTLTTILGFGGLMKMRMTDDDPNRQYLEEILAAGKGTARIVKGLLALSRKQLIYPRPLELNRLLENIRKMVERTIQENIKLHLLPGREGLTVMVDSTLIQQVILILTANARDAMPDGGELVIETGELTMDEEYIRHQGYGEPGRYAWISFKDSGSGIDQGISEKIFEPFFSTKEPGKGTGLGLPIVYGIIKQHRGYINVYSEPGQGTTFRIYLPIHGGKLEQTEQNKACESVT